jgi:aspartate/methionine/tyrosine aminotransferase
MADSLLDFTSGDPAQPLTSIARYAFRMAAKVVHHYPLLDFVNDPRYAIIEDIAKYFQQRGFLKNSFCSANVIVTGGGTTEAFELVIRLLACDVIDRLTATGDKIEPVIIMPVPTYGFFFNSPTQWGFELAVIERDMDAKDPASRGRVDPKKLAKLCTDLQRQGKRVVAYYDSNPNNPTGYIRQRKETSELMHVLAVHSMRQKEHDREVNKKRLDDMEKRGCTRQELMKAQMWRGPASRIRIIDDIVYDGLEYAGQPKGCGFAELDKDAWCSPASDTFTIAGPSKAGLVNLRAGVIISEDAPRLRNMQLATSYSSH